MNFLVYECIEELWYIVMYENPMGNYTVGSARVVTSPIESSSPEAILRNIRRMIFPDRVCM